MAAHESSVSETAAGPALAQLIALTCWIGAAVFFASTVARAAFDVLPTRELAGALVGRLLPVIFLAGLVVGVAAIALELIGPRRPQAALRGAAGGIMAIACGIAQFGIAPRIATLRAGGSLADLPLDAPARVAFQRLHMLSVAWLGVAILAAIAAAVLAAIFVARRARR